MNIRLRSQIQYLENKLLDAASAAPVERRDLVYRHLLSKEEKLESLEREIQLLNDEMETVRTKLSFNAKSSSILANNPPRKANPPKFVLNEKEQALGVIFHEVRRLKEGYSLLKNEKEILDLQVNFSIYDSNIDSGFLLTLVGFIFLLDYRVEIGHHGHPTSKSKISSKSD